MSVTVQLDSYADDLLLHGDHTFVALSALTGEFWTGGVLMRNNKTQKLSKLQMNCGVSSIALAGSDVKPVLLCGTDKCGVEIVDISEAKGLHRVSLLRGHDDLVSGVLSTSDGRGCISSSWDGTIKLWDIETGKQVGEKQGRGEPLMGIASSSLKRRVEAGDHFTAWGRGTWLLKWKHGDQEANPVASVDASEEITSVSGSWVGTRGGLVEEPASGKKGKKLGRKAIRSVSLSADGKSVVTAGDECVAEVWRSKQQGWWEGEWDKVAVVQHEDSVTRAVLSDDGTFLASVAWDKTLKFTPVVSK